VPGDDTNTIFLLNGGLSRPVGVRRHLWMAAEGDIVVCAVPVEDDFLRYVCETSGLDPAKLTILPIGRDVTEQTLVSSELVGTLRPLMAASACWQLCPGVYTEGVAQLAELLGLTVHTGLQFAAQRGPELLNRKSAFRQLATGAGARIPNGCVATGPRELAAGIERYLPQTGTVIVKRDNDLGGHGNRALTTKEVVPLRGVGQTIPVDGNLLETAARLWAELTADGERNLVVESYHQAEQVFYFEYFLHADGRPRILSSGLRRDALGEPGAPSLVWVGLDLPADLRPSTAMRALTQSGRLAELTAQLGYRGHLNIDAIVTADGEVFFNELNARWGGGTTLHHIGVRLFGENYADDHVLSGLRIVRPRPFREMVGLLHRHGLHYTAQSGEGALVVGCDYELVRPTECVLVGPSWPRVRQLEARVREVAGTVTDPALVGSALTLPSEKEERA
jgi:Pre ATP-grasp domain/PGM1 C-terminal domain